MKTKNKALNLFYSEVEDSVRDLLEYWAEAAWNAAKEGKFESFDEWLTWIETEEND